MDINISGSDQLGPATFAASPFFASSSILNRRLRLRPSVAFVGLSRLLPALFNHFRRIFGLCASAMRPTNDGRTCVQHLVFGKGAEERRFASFEMLGLSDVSVFASVGATP